MKYLVTVIVILEIGCAYSSICNWFCANKTGGNDERQQKLLISVKNDLFEKFEENKLNYVMFVGSLCLNAIFLLTILALSFYVFCKRHNQMKSSGFGKLNDTQFHFYNEVQFQKM